MNDDPRAEQRQSLVDSWSPRTAPPGEEIDYLEAAARGRGWPMRFRMLAGQRFQADLKWHSVGALTLANVHVGAHRAERCSATVGRGAANSPRRDHRQREWNGAHG